MSKLWPYHSSRHGACPEEDINSLALVSAPECGAQSFDSVTDVCSCPIHRVFAGNQTSGRLIQNEKRIRHP